MKHFVFSFLIFFFVSHDSFATVEITEVESYKKIYADLSALNKVGELEETLLAFDIDETLLVVEDCLKPGEADGFVGWLKKAHQCPAQLAEEGVADYVREFQSWNINTIALTARADNLLKPTERELSRNGIDFNGYPFKSEDNFKEAFTAKSSVVFKDGVTYSSGRNKGEVLKTLLARLPRTYKQVVFIDDGIKNIRAMKKAFEGDDRVHVKVYHYTRHN